MKEKIIKHGDPDFVINDPSVRRVYLGEKFTLLILIICRNNFFVIM